MKTIFFILFAFVVSATCSAQQPTWSWARSDGHVTGYENSNALATDLAGNSYVSGQFNGPSIIFGNDTVFKSIPSGMEGYIVKYDNLGNVAWAKGIHGWGNALVLDMTCDNSGNLIITGSMSSVIYIDSDTLTTTTGPTVFLFKLDPNGNVLWGQLSVGPGSAYGSALATNSSGEIVLGGYYNMGTLAFGSYSAPSASNDDIFIACFDGSGNCTNMTAVTVNSIQRIYDIALAPNGDIAITGVYNNTQFIIGNDTLPAGSSYNIFVASFTSQLIPQWARSGIGNTNDEMYGIVVDASGNIYTAGVTRSAQLILGNDTIFNTVNYDQAIVIKYDAAGNLTWFKSYGNPTSYDMAHDICLDMWGNPTIIGHCDSNTVFGSQVIANAGAFVARLDANGNTVWVSWYGTGAGAWTCGTDYTSKIIVSGNINSATTFGAITVTPVGQYDIYIAQMDVTTGINAFGHAEQESVYPNPCTDVLDIGRIPINGQAEVLNSLGEVVIIIEPGQKPLNTAELAPGIYFIRTGTTTVKFIHQ